MAGRQDGPPTQQVTTKRCACGDDEDGQCHLSCPTPPTNHRVPPANRLA